MWLMRSAPAEERFEKIGTPSLTHSTAMMITAGLRMGAWEHMTKGWAITAKFEIKSSSI